MICAVCYDMLRGHQGSQWRGTFDLHFDHHTNRQRLKASAGMSCCICRSLLTELRHLDEKNRKWGFGSVLNNIYTGVRKTIWSDFFRMLPEGRSSFISAYLSELYGTGHPGIYRLDFKLKDKERVGTFVLQRLDLKGGDTEKKGTSLSQHSEDHSTSTLHTPFSSSTESDEVLSLAREWIKQCSLGHEGCPRKGDYDSWYPSRLIDLGRATELNERVNSRQVKLVSTKELLENGRRKDRFYVTLSHCWGKAKFMTLTEDKLARFYRGIQIDTLPRTFRDAISFARRLSRQVRYIWIDSLCIIQGNSPAQYEDWLRESSQMFQIYRNSYCNLSATAAADSEKGLFFKREPRELWEDDINLNVEGIPGKGQPWRQELNVNVGDSETLQIRADEILSRSVGAIHGETTEQRIERCRILDVSFWERHVDDAPVNRRGWVLQERLMAPRVLHFCQDQIAWECRDLEAAESARTGLPIFRIKAGGDIIPGGKLKSLIPHKENDERNGTQAENPFHDPPHPTSDIHLYRCWKHVVEVYSKTRLTNPEDKLISLSGIAKMMHDQINDTYLAGMWSKYLASQLLWYVDPVYEDGRFYYRSERPKFFRAPTFSWAAVDAHHGVKCGEITDEGLLIEVEEVNVTPVSEENKFGLVDTGYLRLGGVMKRIELEENRKNDAVRFSWHLMSNMDEEVIIHWNVYLDSPESDTDILGRHGRVYCLPARKDDAGYLICLLLQLEKDDEGLETGRYKRVGLTKIPPYETGQERLLALHDENIPHADWHAGDKKHTVEIV